MKRLTLLAVAGALLVSVFALAAGSDAVEKAQAASRTWLALVDSGKYAESWETTSSLFKGAVTKDGWASACRQARTPLGALKARSLKSANRTSTLPGTPPGDYVVIQYDAQYEKAPSAVETVTFMLDKDGAWRAAGYFIK